MQRFAARIHPNSTVCIQWGIMRQRIKWCGLTALLLAFVASANRAAAQDKPEAPTPKSASSTSESQAASDQHPAASTDPTVKQDDNPKRILGIIPNFQTKNDQPTAYEPMSVKEKYVLAWHQTVD